MTLSSQSRACLERALDGLRYGTVQLVIHDAQIVRIERNERFRLTGAPEAPSTPDTLGPPTLPTEGRREKGAASPWRGSIERRGS